MLSSVVIDPEITDANLLQVFDPETAQIERALSPPPLRTLSPARASVPPLSEQHSDAAAPVFWDRNKARIGTGLLIAGALASLPVTWPLLVGVIGVGLTATAVAGAGVLLGLAVTPKTPAPNPRDPSIKSQQSRWARFGRFCAANKGKILGGILALGAVASLPFVWPLLVAAVAVKIAIVIATLAPIAIEPISLGVGHYFDRKREKASRPVLAWDNNLRMYEEQRLTGEDSASSAAASVGKDTLPSTRPGADSALYSRTQAFSKVMEASRQDSFVALPPGVPQGSS